MKLQSIKSVQKTETNIKLIIFLIALLVLIAGSLLTSAFLLFRARQKQRVSTKSRPTQALPLNPTASPTSIKRNALSNDDSVQTMEKELNQTPTDDFSQDFQQINQDINGL